jgi:hypothetical protein
MRKQPQPLVRFILGDAGTYLYLNDKRPAASCRPSRNTGPSWTCDSYIYPAKELDEDDCYENWDKYYYGINFHHVNVSLYFKKFLDGGVTASRRTEALRHKDVR